MATRLLIYKYLAQIVAQSEGTNLNISLILLKNVPGPCWLLNSKNAGMMSVRKCIHNISACFSFISNRGIGLTFLNLEHRFQCSWHLNQCTANMSNLKCLSCQLLNKNHISVFKLGGIQRPHFDNNVFYAFLMNWYWFRDFAWMIYLDRFTYSNIYWRFHGELFQKLFAGFVRLKHSCV